MTEDLDTLLTALYVEIDDHVAPPRQGRGRRPRLTDAELVCLAVAQVLLGFDCEHRWIRFAYCRLGHLFRYLPNQPGYHKRLRAAAPLLAQAISHLARVSPSWCDSLRLIGRHAAAVWGLAGDGQPLGSRRNRRIRVRCRPHPLLLGPRALSGHRALRNAYHLVPRGESAPSASGSP